MSKAKGRRVRTKKQSKAAAKAKPASALVKRRSALLRAASSQPGVKAVMDVYSAANRISGSGQDAYQIEHEAIQTMFESSAFISVI